MRKTKNLFMAAFLFAVVVNNLNLSAVFAESVKYESSEVPTSICVLGEKEEVDNGFRRICSDYRFDFGGFGIYDASYYDNSGSDDENARMIGLRMDIASDYGEDYIVKMEHAYFDNLDHVVYSSKRSYLVPANKKKVEIIDLNYASNYGQQGDAEIQAAPTTDDDIKRVMTRVIQYYPRSEHPMRTASESLGAPIFNINHQKSFWRINADGSINAEHDIEYDMSCASNPDDCGQDALHEGGKFTLVFNKKQFVNDSKSQRVKISDFQLKEPNASVGKRHTSIDYIYDIKPNTALLDGEGKQSFFYQQENDRAVTSGGDKLFLQLNLGQSPVSNIDFKISYPHGLSTSIINFYDSATGKNTDDVIFYVDGSDIIGFYDDVAAGNVIALDSYLDEGFFERDSPMLDSQMPTILLFLLILVVFILCIYVEGRKIFSTGKPKESSKSPHDGLSAFTLGSYLSGGPRKQYLSAMIVELANHGFIIIEEMNPEKNNGSSYLIRKGDDYNGVNPEERVFLNELFSEGDTVDSNFLLHGGSVAFFRMTSEFNKLHGEDIKRCIGRKSKSGLIWVFMLILLSPAPLVELAVRTDNLLRAENGLMGVLILYFLAAMISLIPNTSLMQKKRPFALRMVVNVLIYLITSVIGMFILGRNIENFNLVNLSWSYYLMLALEALMISFMYTAVYYIDASNVYTEYGMSYRLYANYIESWIKNVSPEKLKELDAKDSQLIFRLLPYAQVLGLAPVLMAKIKNIQAPYPKWGRMSADTLKQKHPLKHFLAHTIDEIAEDIETSDY